MYINLHLDVMNDYYLILRYSLSLLLFDSDQNLSLVNPSTTTVIEPTRILVKPWLTYHTEPSVSKHNPFNHNSTRQRVHLYTQSVKLYIRISNSPLTRIFVGRLLLLSYLSDSSGSFTYIYHFSSPGSRDSGRLLVRLFLLSLLR